MVEREPNISVIIVSWNTRELLLQCLRTIEKAASDIELEITVVDNGSSDGSAELVQTQFPMVLLIQNNGNVGFAAANNQAIRQSRSTYICLVNSDVEVFPNTFLSLLHYLQKNPRVGMVGPRILNPDGSLQASCRKYPNIWNTLCSSFALHALFPQSSFFSGGFMDFWNHDEVRSVDVLSGCFWMVRKQAIEDVGLLDEGFFMYAEDIDWCKRFHDAGWDVVLYPGAEAIHYGGASSSNAPVRFYVEMLKARKRYWKKHHNLLQRFVLTVVSVLGLALRVVIYASMVLAIPHRRKEAKLKVVRSLKGIVCLAQIWKCD